MTIISLQRLMNMQHELQDHIRRQGERPLVSELDPIAQGEYIKEDILALEDELHEALGHVGWKSWAKERGILNRDAFLRESVDALFFLMNLFNAVGATAAEVIRIYVEKHARNWQRYQGGNYSMVDNKCAHCGDDFGDVAARQDVSKELMMQDLWTHQEKSFCSKRCMEAFDG